MGLELPLRMVGNIVITTPKEKSGLSFSKQICSYYGVPMTSAEIKIYLVTLVGCH